MLPRVLSNRLRFRAPYHRLAAAMRNPFVRLQLALTLGLALVAGGTLGYVLIERYPPLDALFMTIITLATVGYDLIRPLHPAGKIFTIALIVGGIGTATWVFASVIEAFTSESALHILARRRMDHRLKGLRQHYLVCGYGRIGQQIATMYQQQNIPYVVIEKDESRLDMLRSEEIPHAEGDASDEAVLKEAGIDRAAALIAVTPTDAINTFIVLTARGIRSDIFIVARADSNQNAAKLYRAGANKVVSPHNLGGRWMGITAFNPAVTEFITAVTELDPGRFQLREITIPPDASLAGRTFGAARFREETGALVVAIRQGAPPGVFLPNPPDGMVLSAGDTVIAIGSPRQVNALSNLLSVFDQDMH